MIKVLFICAANLNRSAMAHAICKSLIEQDQLQDEIFIDSAGISNTHVGKPPFLGTRKILNKNKISYEGLYSRQVTEDDIKTFDYIIAMDSNYLKDLKKLIIDEKDLNKINLFFDYIPDTEEKDVLDPSVTGEYEEAFHIIHSGCQHIIEFLQNQVKQNKYMIYSYSIGKGSTCKLYNGVNRHTNEKLVFKIMQNISHAKEEAKIIQTYPHHPHLIKFVDFFIKGDKGIIVMERHPGGNLGNYKYGKKRNIDNAVNITINVLKGIKQLHESGIIHSDIIPHNILMSNDDPKTIKIVDYGASVFTDANSEFHGIHRGGTPEYAPPELKKGESHIDFSSDIYQVGCLCLYLLNGEAPENVHDACKQITDFKLKNILMKATHEQPLHRFRSADEFIHALTSYLDELKVNTSLAFIIPTVEKRKKLLKYNLKHLMEYIHIPFTVYVYNDDGTPLKNGLLDIIKEMNNEFIHLVVLNEHKEFCSERIGCGGARHYLFENAKVRHEIVTSLDDDMIITEGWYEAMKEAIDAHPNHSVFTGLEKDIQGKRQIAGSYMFMEGNILKRVENRTIPEHYCMTDWTPLGYAVFCRQALQPEIQVPKVFVREDSAFYLELKKRGINETIVTSKAIALHRPIYSPPSGLRTKRKLNEAKAFFKETYGLEREDET